MKVHQVIRILDKGPYRENLDRPLLPEDVGIVSVAGTLIETDYPFEAFGRQVFHRLQPNDGLRLHGLHFRVTQSSEPRTILFVAGHAVVENCWFDLAGAGQTGENFLRNNSLTTTAGTPGLTVIRECRFNARLSASMFHSAATVLITRNFSHDWPSHNLELIGNGQSAVRFNVVDSPTGVGGYCGAVSKSAKLEISNNLIMASSAWQIRQECETPFVTVRNNLFLSQNGIELIDGPEHSPHHKQWRVDHNAYARSSFADPKRNLPQGPTDLVADPQFLSRVVGPPDVLRLPPQSPMRTKGHGLMWPTFLGPYLDHSQRTDKDWFSRVRDWPPPNPPSVSN